uniref:RdRp n=1 Tax=Hubei partiti-like virus 44 TaxID=1923052 RepID=A0A1L3KLG0_9VIRU|nr:RdRp [Hubei partiti-like virus 44]
MLRRLSSKSGFAQRHYASTYPSPYLKFLPAPTDLWRSPVTLPLIKRDLFEFVNNSKIDSTNVPSKMRQAIKLAEQAFRIPKQPMLHLNDVMAKSLPIWSRSPGLPWTQLGYTTKRQVRDDPEAVSSIRKFWHYVKRGKVAYAPDSCAFVRSHVAAIGEYKVRAVWGYPMTMTMGEAVFALPLIEAYQLYDSPIAYGFETLTGGHHRLTQLFRDQHYYAGLDFSKFDKTVPPFLIEIAMAILAKNIDFGVYRDHGVADAELNFAMFKFIKDYLIATPIRLCNGERFRKDTGIASGSYFTQLVGSIVNFILVNWLYLELTGRPPRVIKVLGDDSLTASDSKLDLTLASQLLGLLGMALNEGKSCQSVYLADLDFLGFKINSGEPGREVSKWMAALHFPERPDKSWDDVASRCVGLLYANSAVCSEFDGLLRWLIKLNPFRLKLSHSITKMLMMLGIKSVSTTLPSERDFFRRLRIM